MLEKRVNKLINCFTDEGVSGDGAAVAEGFPEDEHFKTIIIDGYPYDVPKHYTQERLVSEAKNLYGGKLFKAAEEAVHYHQDAISKQHGRRSLFPATGVPAVDGIFCATRNGPMG